MLDDFNGLTSQTMRRQFAKAKSVWSNLEKYAALGFETFESRSTATTLLQPIAAALPSRRGPHQGQRRGPPGRA